MDDNLTNLLPQSALRQLRREYFLRLATIAAVMVTTLLLAHAALLTPTYFYSRDNAAVKQAELDAIRQSRTTSEEREFADRLAVLREDVVHLERLNQSTTGSSILRQMLAVPRPGVAVTGFTFTPEQQEQAAAVTISGQARTRDSLRAYVSALEAAPWIAKAELPISAYAKESDIAFTITVTLQQQ